MDRKQQGLSLTCHNFSDIRRRPLVIGKLDSVRLPFVVTMPQLAIGAIVFGVLYLTKPVWGALMSDRLHIVVFVVVPIVIAQQISRTTVEGRSLSKATMGLFRLWASPRNGTVNGRRQRPPGFTMLRVQPLIDEPDRRPHRERRPRRRRVLQARRRPRVRHVSATTAAHRAGGRRTSRAGGRGPES